MRGKSAIVILALILTFSLSHFMIPRVAAVEGDSWETLKPMQEARSGLGVAVVDGKIYVIGGSNFDGYLDTNEVYDPATDTWTSKASMSTFRGQFGIAVVDNKIYCIGGGGEVNEVYNPSTDTWETKAPLSTPRIGLTAEALDGKIYVIGGKIGEIPHHIVSSVTKVYHPSNDTWTTVAPIPTPVYDHASAVVNGKIYVMGGNTKNTVGVNLTQVYDPDTDTWSQGAQMPTGVDSAAARATTGVWAPKRIYVIGGKQNIDPVTLNQIYNPKTNTWTTGSPMSTRRYGLGVAVVNDTLYAIGGMAGVNYPIYAKNTRYTPAGWIPEYPTWLPLLLLMVVLTVTAVICNRRMNILNGPA